MDGEVRQVEEEGAAVVARRVPLDDLLGLVGEEVGGVGAEVVPGHAHVPPEVVAPSVLVDGMYWLNEN